LELEREAQFHGAMDGAMKFVKGDALAGMAITAVNLLGGLLVVCLQRGLPIGEALERYTLLTIGDGLVSQIPALVISTSAGIIVSRAASDVSMGKEFMQQFGLQPQALAVSSGIIILFGLIPGLPHLPFLLLGILMGGISLIAFNKTAADKEEQKVEAEKEKKAATPLPGAPETVESLLPLDILQLEVGYGLIPLVDEAQEGDLLERIRAIRRQFAMDMGMIIPPLHVRDNLQLKPDQYVLLKGVEVAKGEIMMGHLLAMDSGMAKRKIEGIPTMEPAFQLPALWIDREKKDEAQVAGYTVVDPSTVIATHLTEVLRTHADELLGRQDTQKLLDNLAKTHPKVVEELVPGLLPLGLVQKVLQNLLRERVSLRDLLTICETLADFAPLGKDPDILTEYVRQKLARSIISSFVDEQGTITVLTLSTQIEDIIRESLQKTDQGVFLNMEPNLGQRLLASAKTMVEKVSQEGYQPIIICSPTIRRHFRRLLERFMPHVMVLSHNELTAQTQLQSLGTIELNPKK
ncbi:MAG: flagellar biosynthesis protein FlhA, partial [Proteobacteria bacterium]|nr:flagellar biosynthesis protein FlhA [Pseudomonadota bacterium]